VKRLALTLLLALAAPAALAQSGPTTLAMTCDQARSTVLRQGAVVLHTGLATYDRFVRDSSFCPNPLTAQTAFVRTADTPQCPIGGVCRDTTVENGQ
jgi:hypothetical protein